LQKNTGLEWTRCSLRDINDVDTTENCKGPHWAGEWKDAVRSCENLDYAGYDDWRLPNIRELQTLVTYDRVMPAIDSSKFPGTKMTHYWSSTSYGSALDMNRYAFVVDFGFGNVHMDAKDNSVQEGEPSGNNYRPYYVRCVRGPDRK